MFLLRLCAGTIDWVLPGNVPTLSTAAMTCAKSTPYPPVRCIVWDWNGTLFDDVHASVSALNTLMLPRGLGPETVVRYRERFNFPVSEYYHAAGFDLAHEDWERLACDYHAAYLAHPDKRLFDDTRAALDILSACGLRQAILSSCEQSILDRLLGETGLADCFSHVYGADNLHGLSKVARGRALLQDLGCTAATTLLVGDTLHDHEVAADLGCRCVLITRGHQSRHRLLTSGRPLLDHLTALPHFIAAGGC